MISEKQLDKLCWVLAHEREENDPHQRDGRKLTDERIQTMIDSAQTPRSERTRLACEVSLRLGQELGHDSGYRTGVWSTADAHLDRLRTGGLDPLTRASRYVTACRNADQDIPEQDWTPLDEYEGYRTDKYEQIETESIDPDDPPYDV